MRRTASEVLHELETRVARLERKAWNPFKKKAPVAPVEEKGDWSINFPVLSFGYDGHLKEVVQVGLENMMDADRETVGDVVKEFLHDMHGKTYVRDTSSNGYNYSKELTMDIKKASVRSVWLEKKSSRGVNIAVVLDVVYDSYSYMVSDGDTYTEDGGKATLVAPLRGIPYMFEEHISDQNAIKYLEKKDGFAYIELWSK